MSIIPNLNFMCFMVQDCFFTCGLLQTALLHRYEEACGGGGGRRVSMEKKKERFVRDTVQVEQIFLLLHISRNK